MGKFCRTCGTALPNDAAFCANCGTVQGAQTVVPKPETRDSRNLDLQELRLVERHLSEIESVIDEQLEIEDAIDSNNKNIEKGFGSYVLLAAVIALLSLVSIFGGANCVNNSSNPFGMGETSLEPVESCANGFGTTIIVFGVIWAIVTIVVICMIPRRIAQINQLKEQNNQYKEQIYQLDLKCDRICEKNYHGVALYVHYFPNGGMNRQGVTEMIGYITSGRAENFGQAMRILEENRHREKMLNESRKQVAQLQRIELQISRAVAETSRAADAATRAANASAYNAYHK